MTDNRTTELLCKLLDERGVEYTTNKSDVYGFEVNTTRWGKHCFYERNTGEKLLESHDLTPEHVIAATLGRGTGEWVLEPAGTLERRVEELENDLVSVHYTVDREHEMIEKLIIVVAVIALAALVVATFVWIRML